MASKITSVRLQVRDEVRVFEVEHAERLLRLPDNGGWHIADDEKVELTENGFRPLKDRK